MVSDIQVNVAYRWFLGFGLTDKVLDASTISQNRRRRFFESTIYQEIFDEIVVQAINRKMVDGSVLYSDSTHLKANANKLLKEKESPPEIKETRVGTIDPDSGYMMQEGKPEGFFYLDHRTVDSRHSIITGIFQTSNLPFWLHHKSQIENPASKDGVCQWSEPPGQPGGFSHARILRVTINPV